MAAQMWMPSHFSGLTSVEPQWVAGHKKSGPKRHSNPELNNDLGILLIDALLVGLVFSLAAVMPLLVLIPTSKGNR